MAKNAIEMLAAQAKAGRKIIGAQVEIGIPGSPVAELVNVAGGVYTFRESLPEDSDKEREWKIREWKITESNAAIVHYLSNRKNKHVVPEEVEVASGILVVNGENIVMGDYYADGKVVIPVPGGVVFSAYRMSDKENTFIVSYDAEKDTMQVSMVLEDGELVTLSSEFDANGETTRLNLVANNRYEEVTNDEGKPETHFLGADLFKIYGLGKMDGYAIISVPIAEMIAVEGDTNHIIINSSKEVDDDGIVTGDKTRAFMLAAGELDELPDVAVSASYGAGKTTVICKNSVAILNDYSGIECLVNDSTVVDDITKHPYYTGKRTVYAEDGSKSTEYLYNDGEEVIRFRRSVSDRGVDVKLA